LVLKSRNEFATDDRGKVIFKDGNNGIIELKKRLANTFNVDFNSILTYDEFMKTPIGEPKQYNVIVMPKGDGDRAAQRQDVKYSFLLFH
jgi:hypothetical protein